MKQPPINPDVFMPWPVDVQDGSFYAGYVGAEPVVGSMITIEPMSDEELAREYGADLDAAEKLVLAAMFRRLAAETPGGVSDYVRNAWRNPVVRLESELAPQPHAVVADSVSVAEYVRAQWA